MTTIDNNAVPQVKPLSTVGDTDERPAAASIPAITSSATNPNANVASRIRRITLPLSFIKTVRLPCHIGA
jgi:hypothetical protein